MPSIIVDLHLTREQCESWYAGETRYVQARSRDGRSVRFPVAVLREHVGHDGIHGCFEIHMDGERRFRSIKRLA